MPVERRERVIAIWLGSTGNGRNPMINGRRQPSRGGMSRMTRECQVRICERLGVKFPGPTRQISLVPAFLVDVPVHSLPTVPAESEKENVQRSKWPPIRIYLVGAAEQWK